MSASAEALELTMMTDANPRYAPLTSTTILVENTAETITYRKEPVKSKSSTSMTFHIDCADKFLGRDMYISWDKIPLTVKRHTATATGFTTTNFHNVFFNDYKDITLTQYGMLNAIDRVTVVIDNKTISTARGSEIMEQIGYYYDKQDLQRHIDCSNHNISYSNLVPDSNPWIPTVTCDGVRTVIKGSSLSQNDPFSATVSDDYNSRVPLFSGDASAAASDKMDVVLHGMSSWIPFNILGINGDVTPIYHAQKILITIDLYANWPSRIFQTKRLPNTSGTVTEPIVPVSPYTFQFNRGSTGTNIIGDVSINCKLYNAPQYINSKLDAGRDKYIQSYSIVEQDSSLQDVKFEGGKDPKISISSVPFDIRATPKRIYIAIVNKRTTDDEYLTDAVHFARIDSLDVELMGVTTNVASGKSAEQLYYISKANGLEMNKQQALYTMGFPVCLDTSDNLACKSNSYVGLSTSESSGKYMLRLKMDATRLQHDTEATEFKLDGTSTALYKYHTKMYELRVIIVYAGFFTYNLMGSKFNIIESLTKSELDSLTQHVDLMYAAFSPKMNILGGSWLSSLAPALKGVGKGVFNVVKAAFGNKNGFRDALAKAYKGEETSTTGGAFDNHAPTLGGNGYQHFQSNVSGGNRGGRSLDSWSS